MSGSEHPTGTSVVISRRLAAATALAVVLIVGGSTAIMAASATRLARAEIELAAARVPSTPTPRPSASGGAATPSPSSAPSATPTTSGSPSPTGPSQAEIETAVTAELVRGCITPLRQLAIDQETRWAKAKPVIAVYGSKPWDDARDAAIGGYRQAWLSMKSAAETLRQRLANSSGTVPSTAFPPSYGSANISGGAAGGAKNRMDGREADVRKAALGLASSPPLKTVAVAAASCPPPG